MCGIAGIVDLAGRAPPDRASLERMIGALWHRGPDECGLYRDRHAGLAHTRLSIIDLASGQQPMTGPDGAWLVFNGEIFNYVELRDELTARGHVFATRSDTEVILHAWAAWGEAALDRFNGQWAFALWEPSRRRLVLSRDRVGVRPLYYAEADGRVIFGSEVKAIFAGAPELPRRWDAAGLDETLTFWSAVAPRTVFDGVRELEPGHVRIYEGGQIEDRVYWQPSYAGDLRGSVAEVAEQVDAALTRATSLRMLRADVDVGSYLSGGLDSSLIAAMGLAAKGRGFQTFSLRFADAEYDEGEFQRTMSAHLGSDHHEIVVSRADIAAAFPETCWHAERPILRTAPAPMFLLSRLVREHGIKVVLTGEGADEMFAGYDLFREGAVRRFWARAPDSQLRPRLLDRLYPYLERSPVGQRAMARAFFGRGLDRWREPGFAHHLRWQTTAGLKRMLRAELRRDGAEAGLLTSLPPAFASWSALAQDQYLEVRTLMSGYLLSAQGDRMLMGHSVEGRFPFLDREVMALAGRIPDAYKLRGLDEKHVLKKVAERLVPESIRRRPKQPYRAPDALAFVGADRPSWCDEMMSARVATEAGVFEPAAVARLWDKVRGKDEAQFSNTDNMAVVAVLSTHLVWASLIASLSVRAAPAQIRTVVELNVP